MPPIASATSGRPLFDQRPSAAPAWLALLLLPLVVGKMLSSAQSGSVANLTIQPSQTTLAGAGTVLFQARVTDGTGAPVFGAPVIWTATGGTITTQGVYHAGAVAGAYRVVATLSGKTVADTALVTISPSSFSSAKGEPAGCTPVYEDNFSSLAGAVLSTGVGLVSVSGAPEVQVTVVTPDLTAPASPPNVLQAAFGAGWGGGSSPGVALRRPLTGDYSSLYLSVWFLLSPGWPGPATGPDLALSFASGPASTARVLFRVGVMRNGELLPHMRVSGLARSYRGSTAPLLVANVDSSLRLTPGVWHQWSMQVVSNGTSNANNGQVTWWLDGVLAGSYSGLGLWNAATPAIRELGIEATPPPTPLAATHYLRLDHWHATGLAHPTVISGTGPDLVQVSGNTTTTATGLIALPELAIFMRARQASTPACLDDHVVDDMLNSTFPGLLAKGDCRPDVIATFSVDDAVRLDGGDCDAGAIWSSAQGELRKEALTPLISVPVVLWLTQELNSASQTEDGGQPLEPLALAELGDATDIFNLHRAGVEFQVVETNRVWSMNATDKAAAILAITAPAGSTNDCAPGLNRSSYFRQGKVNIYYVGSLTILNAAGLTCRSIDPNIIYVSNDDRTGTTLAHELGHALSLEHVGDGNSGPWYVGIGNTNLMWGNEVDNRGSLTLGQVYRVNGDARSVLHRDLLRTGPRWVCECTFGQPGCETWLKYRDSTKIDGVCPRMTRDWK